MNISIHFIFLCLVNLCYTNAFVSYFLTFVNLNYCVGLYMSHYVLHVCVPICAILSSHQSCTKSMLYVEIRENIG